MRNKSGAGPLTPRYSIAILAGGESRRMGRDKALEPLAGRPVIGHVIGALEPLAKDVFIVANDYAAYGGFGLPVRADHYDFRASLVGVYSALASAAEDHCFVTACDLPFADPALVQYMSGLAAGYDAVVPVSHRGREPLHAFYSKSCMETMRAGIEGGDLAIRHALDKLKVREVTTEEMESVCNPAIVFLNINSPEDLKAAERLAPEMEDASQAGDTASASTGTGSPAATNAEAPPAATPLVCFVGNKNSGKTTFIEKLVPILAGRGLKVAYIKHDVHGFDIDHEGTDTWRIGRAGARVVKISSPEMMASVVRVDEEKSLDELRSDINGSVDLIIVEGYKRSGTDRIEVSRSGAGAASDAGCASSNALACREEDLVAVISDRPDAAVSIPVFDIDDAEAVAGFLVERYGLIKKVPKRP